jgi:hypothetical protein
MRGLGLLMSFVLTMAVAGGASAQTGGAPQILNEQHGLQVSGTLAETDLYSFVVPANTLSEAASGRRIHLELYVHLSNNTTHTDVFELGLYFGGKKIADSQVNVFGYGNQGYKLDAWFSVGTLGVGKYLCAEVAADFTNQFAYNSPVLLEAAAPLMGETLYDVPAQIDPSVDNILKVTVKLEDPSGNVYAIMGHGMTILD